MRTKAIRYYRCVFVRPDDRVSVDFGYYGWPQALESISNLRKQYSDYRYHKGFRIDAPEWGNKECEFCGDPATKIENFDRPVPVCNNCSAEES